MQHSCMRHAESAATFVNFNSFFWCSMSDYQDELLCASVFVPWTIMEQPCWVIKPSTNIAATSQSNRNTDITTTSQCEGMYFEIDIPRNARVHYTDGSWRVRKPEEAKTHVSVVEKRALVDSDDSDSDSSSSDSTDRSSSSDSSSSSSPVIIQRPPEDLELCEPQPGTPHKRRKTLSPSARG